MTEWMPPWCCGLLATPRRSLTSSSTSQVGGLEPRWWAARMYAEGTHFWLACLHEELQV